MKDVRILVSKSAPPRIADGVAAHFTPQIWGGPGDGVGPGVRGIAGGHAKVDAALMDRLPDLEIVANYGVGYDTVDAVEAGRRGIVVTNTPDVLNEEVADTVCFLSGGRIL